jgi:hypothetical protein
MCEKADCRAEKYGKYSGLLEWEVGCQPLNVVLTAQHQLCEGNSGPEFGGVGGGPITATRIQG